MGKKVKQPVMGRAVKVPVILQMESLECGAAALAMVMAYYEKWIPLEQVRLDCGVSRDGSNAKNIMLAARSYGMKAQGYRYEPETLKEKGKFPCIVFWEFNHFVVLNGFKRGKALINDPARGMTELSMQDFDKSFTGVCIMLEPSEGFVPGGKRKSLAGFVKKQLRGTGAVFAFTVLVSLITALFGVMNPVFSKVFLDKLLPGLNDRWRVPFFLFLAAFAVMQIILSAMQAAANPRMRGKLAIRADAGYMWHILRMPVEFFSQRQAEDIVVRKTANQTIAGTLIDTLAPVVLNILMMVIYLAVILRYSVPLTVIGIGGMAINIAVEQYIAGRRMNIARVQMRDEGKLASVTVSGIEMMETVKASGAENGFFEKWSGYQASVNTGRIKENRLSLYYGMIPKLVNVVVNTGILAAGLYLIIRGEYTVGMLFAFQTMLSSFMAPVVTLSDAMAAIREMRVNMERIEDVMEYPPDVEYAGEPLEGVNKIAKTIENKGFSRKGKADGKNFVRWKPLHILERCKEKRQGKTAVRHGLGIVFKL